MMRIITLFTHALFTAGLYWTKFDSIQVTLQSGVDNTARYKFADQSYTGLLSVALIFLFIELIYVGLETQITLWSVLHLFLDFVACLFTAWIALDGLPWQTYTYVFVFCVMIPAGYDVSTTVQSQLMGLRMKVKGPSRSMTFWPF